MPEEMDIIDHIKAAQDELNQWARRVKRLESIKIDMETQIEALAAREKALSQELRERNQEIDDLIHKQKEISEKIKHIEETEVIMQKEREVDRDRKLQLDKWEADLKAKSERIQRILSA